MSTHTRYSEDPDRRNIILKLKQKAKEESENKKRNNDEIPQPDDDDHHEFPKAWKKLSPLTHTAAPPLVVHIPMTRSERKEQEEMVKQEAAVRFKHGGSRGVHESSQERDLPLEEHPLPHNYRIRVTQLAKKYGFSHRGLAMATISPEHHLWHLMPSVLETMMNEINQQQQQQQQEEENLSHPFLPPQGDRASEIWMPPSEHAKKSEITKEPFESEMWHEWVRSHTEALLGPGDTIGSDAEEEEEEEDDSGTTTTESIQEWQEKFSNTMRRRNHMQRGIVDWQKKWKEWAINSKLHPTYLDTRHRALGILYSRLINKEVDDKGKEVENQISSVYVQTPRPRVLRSEPIRKVAPLGLKRQPSMWQWYREPWDAPNIPHDSSKRNLADLNGDSRTGRRVRDPALTEQWNLFDPYLWGNLPPGPHVIRPSLSAGPPVWDGLGYNGSTVCIGIVDSGIELGHPELRSRHRRAISFDALDTRSHGQRPPVPIDPWIEIHGTQVAGVALAQRNNRVCGAGVAPAAKLGAIRLLGLRSPNDAEEAAAISHACKPHGRHPARNALINHIFSCSWGPLDDGADMRGPGPLATHALKACVHHGGRHGKGTIYVWAGGNGRTAEDNVNFDGYANLPETIAVGAIDDGGHQAWYSEPGACLMVSAPSSGGSSGIVTSDPSGPAGLATGQCARDFGGTSAAAPSVAGVVALMLQANPELGWRDVQHILVRCSNHIMYPDRREPWTQTEAGYWHSHGYGFGLLNATCSVLLSKEWTPLLPRQAHVFRTHILNGRETWDGVALQMLRMPVQRYPNGDVVPEPEEDEETKAERKRGLLDTTGYDIRTGNHKPAAATVELNEEPEPLAGDFDDPDNPEALTEAEKNDLENREIIFSAMFWYTRLAAKYARNFYKSVEDMAAVAKAKRDEATRELAPNRVRISETSGTSVAIPPGFEAHFNWVWPEGEHSVDLLEHVGLKLDAYLPSGRGLLRIWLCGPSGTCSLMAQAPRTADLYQQINGEKWTFWTVRHWDERTQYQEDRTGHGAGTWSLRLSHTWPSERSKAQDLRDYRIRHPQQVDATIHWWQLEFRGSQET
jgi:hypothetical protein